MIVEYHMKHHVFYKVSMKYNENTAVSDRDDDEEVIKKPSQEEMLTAFDTM